MLMFTGVMLGMVLLVMVGERRRRCSWRAGCRKRRWRCRSLAGSASGSRSSRPSRGWSPRLWPRRSSSAPTSAPRYWRVKRPRKRAEVPAVRAEAPPPMLNRGGAADRGRASGFHQGRDDRLVEAVAHAALGDGDVVPGGDRTLAGRGRARARWRRRRSGRPRRRPRGPRASRRPRCTQRGRSRGPVHGRRPRPPC